MPEPKHNEVVSEEALRRGISDQDSQDSKSHNSQKQVASNDDGGNGADGVGSSSSGSSSQPREVSWSSTSLYHGELPDSASSLQPDESVNMMDQGSSASNEETPATETSEDAAVSVSNQQLTIPLFDSTTHSDRTQDQLVGEGLERATVPSRFSPVNSLGPSIRRGPANGQYATTIQEYMDHTTITAEASRNIGKLEPMAELPPINDNFYPNDGPGIQGVNINNGMLMLSSWNGDMVDGSNQSICVILSPGLNLSPGGGIDSSCDVYVSNADNDLMHLG
ncbi:unnamed protein product [Sphagnum jensenii]|uniref:Uncharacterized protein n=1 Tax=Sphagnum jensenii TaxID=128206 RepID=A0ABP0VQ31_9BRYO